ncbi:hypothetical protein [Avibacterium avium]|uniref:hypothetical protein n=1 Tax=Avibacterium avium TaxID=751 RepID=UPI0039FDB90E
MPNKKFLLTLLFFIINNSNASNLLTQVKEKLSNDKLALEQFQYLGTLHCLDVRIGMGKNSLFTNEYIHLYSNLYPFPRLFKSNKLLEKYIVIEKDVIFPKKGVMLDKYFHNDLNSCLKLYSSSNIKKQYLDFISKKINYIDEDPDSSEYEDEKTIRENMLDYINRGKLDVHRFVDGLPKE